MTDSPIENYLDELLLASASSPPREARHLLAETEAHLRDAAGEAVDAGDDPEEAEHHAVTRFGSAGELARKEAAQRVVPLRALWRPFLGSGLLVGGLGGVAVGISGVINAILEATLGRTFVVNISHHAYLAPSDCARWLGLDHTTQSCYQAALNDWAWEEVANRVAVGVVGIGSLIAYVLLRRRWSERRLPVGLPRGPVDAVAFATFAAAGLWLLGFGIDALVVNAPGAGQGFGTAPALLVLAFVYGRRLLEDLRTSPA